MKEKILTVLGVILVLGSFWLLMAVGTVYEEHQLCMNGALEHCIEQDYIK